MVAEKGREPDVDPEIAELFEGEPHPSSLDAAMREAVEAVEGIERRKKAEKGKLGSEPATDPKPQTAAPPVTQPVDEEEMERLRQEVASLRDVSLRTLADFDNFRKRVERERQEIHRYALLEPMREILPILDNLERALAASGRAEDLKLGVELILKQMQDLLSRLNVLAVPALGRRFDPAVHQAVMQEEDAGVGEPTVSSELQKGYTLHDRLIRPAMVKVAMPVSRRPESPETGS